MRKRNLVGTLLLAAAGLGISASGTSPGEHHEIGFYEVPKKVAIFAGHLPKYEPPDYEGAISATGKREYKYNDAIVSLFEDSNAERLHLGNNLVQYEPVPSEEMIPFHQRVAFAEKMHADIFIAIHHDNARPIDLRIARRQGRRSPLWKKLSGFSISILPNTDSIPAKYFEESKRLAELIADKFLKSGRKPSYYLSSTYQLLDSARGIYLRPHLRVLKDAGGKMIAILIERNNISNPYVLKIISTPKTEDEFAEALNSGVEEYIRQELFGQSTKTLITPVHDSISWPNLNMETRLLKFPTEQK